ncbi:twin-arginine translocase TatA/TatE family subunit [soil metagenome]
METLFLFGLGTGEVILIALAVLLLFGGKKIPELMRGIGKGVREFNTAKDSLKTELEEGMREQPTVVKKESVTATSTTTTEA